MSNITESAKTLKENLLFLKEYATTTNFSFEHFIFLIKEKIVVSNYDEELQECAKACKTMLLDNCCRNVISTINNLIEMVDRYN